MSLCIICNKKEIEIKSRKLCRSCYYKIYSKGQIENRVVKGKVGFDREMAFAKEYFDCPDDYLYQPATFNLKECRYRPDFYDKVNDVWIELICTRQAYHSNKHKYLLFEYHYPKLKLLVLTPDGKTLNQIPKNKNIKWLK